MWSAIQGNTLFCRVIVGGNKAARAGFYHLIPVAPLARLTTTDGQGMPMYVFIRI